jgi:hypothetical protein
MESILILGLLTATLFGFGQTTGIQIFKTNKYSGVYSFGNDVEKGEVGVVTVYAETDSTILFFIDICRGAPSYNLGQRYSRLKIINGEGIFIQKMIMTKKDVIGL